MSYHVSLTLKAEQDIESTLQWFDQQSAASAGTRWLKQLLNRIATLETRPQRCPLAAEATALCLDIRELSFGRRRGSYRIFFQILGSRVIILRVWHAARDFPAPEDL